MIAHLSGTLLLIEEETLVIDVSGVGYEVLVTRPFAETLQVGQEMKIVVYTVVREDSLTLYGFGDLIQKKLFLRLISVSGIGPKLALAMLSHVAPQELIQAIFTENLLRLTAIPGIGKKSAERLVLELKDKLLGLVDDSAHSVQTSQTQALSRAPISADLLSALINLGYNRFEIEKKLERVTLTPNLPFEQAFKEALRFLGSA